MPSIKHSMLYTFGVFDFDPLTGELRKRGIRIRIPDQSVAILTLLLENQGRLITREEIREKLWGSSTAFDFDQGINSAVRRLREALGDSPNHTRFLETLPRRGYRFIASVRRHGEEPEAAPLRQGRSGWRKLIHSIFTI